MAERAESLVAPTGSNWQHRPEISRNGWKGFDFGLEVGPSYFSWLELIDSTDGRARRCARPIKLLDTKSGKMVGMTGLEPATSWSQTTRATNCATSRQENETGKLPPRLVSRKRKTWFSR